MNVAKKRSNYNLNNLQEWEKDFYTSIIVDIRRQFKDVKVKIDTTINETYVFNPDQVEVVAMLLTRENFSVVNVKENECGFTIFVKKNRK